MKTICKLPKFSQSLILDTKWIHTDNVFGTNLASLTIILWPLLPNSAFGTSVYPATARIDKIMNALMNNFFLQ